MLTIDVIVNFIAHYFVSMQTKSQFGAPRIQMLVKREHDERWSEDGAGSGETKQEHDKDKRYEMKSMALVLTMNYLFQ